MEHLRQAWDGGIMSLLHYFGAGGVVLAYRSEAKQNGGATITVPSDAAAGDVAVLWDFAFKSSGAPTTVVPSGFSTIFNNNGTMTYRGIASYKILDGTEASTSLTGMNETEESKILVLFSAGAASVAEQDVDSAYSASNPSAQTVTASGGTAPLLVLGFAATRGSAPTAFDTASPAFDAEVVYTPASPYLMLGYKIYNPGDSLSNHSVDIDDYGAQILGTCYLEVS